MGGKLIYYQYKKLNAIESFTNSSINNIPVFIICYNQYTFVKSMVDQLLKYTNNIYIIDNKSTYPPLVKYLKDMENKINIIYKDKNYGHFVYKMDDIVQLGGEKYIITDPDLELNPNLPMNFIEILYNLSEKYKANKVGFALDIVNNINPNLTCKINDIDYKITEWEKQFWENKIDDDTYELYNADIDTTFVLINPKYPTDMRVRVAGDFTCIHKPWVIDYEKKLLDGELDYYKNNNNISSTWIGK